MPIAAYANADNTDVALTRDDGSVVAVKPGDARLKGMTITPFLPPLPPSSSPRSIEQIVSDVERIQSELQALVAG